MIVAAGESPYLKLLEEQDMFEELTPPSDIVILRHGRFRGNITTASGGDQADLALVSSLAHESDFTEGLDNTGIGQAETVRSVLDELLPDIEVCLSSDYQRAQHMARLVVPTAHIVLSELMRERSRGDVTGIPKSQLGRRIDELNAVSPFVYPNVKEEDPLGWWPHDGEPLSAKREWFRSAMPLMAELAPDKPLLLSTHGEVVIAARSAKELGDMDNETLIEGITPDCPGLTVDNGQFDWWTRRNPESGELAPVFTHLRSISACGTPPLDTGFMRIR